LDLTIKGDSWYVGSQLFRKITLEDISKAVSGLPDEERRGYYHNLVFCGLVPAHVRDYDYCVNLEELDEIALADIPTRLRALAAVIEGRGER
jgi:hypothetical protein